MRRPVTLLVTTLLAAMFGVAGAQAAAAAPADKLEVLASWTQTTRVSYDNWNAARQNQAAWAAYGFDWSTDYCTGTPDNPLGFDFTLACYRHDFGYRNYKAAGLFTGNKARIDVAFYRDMLRRCATSAAALRPACESLAWTYFQVVQQAGLTVTQADIDRAARLLPPGRGRAGGKAAAQRWAW